MSVDLTRNKNLANSRSRPILCGDVFNPRKMFVCIFIPEALVATSTISSTAKLVWGHLARRAGENGLCFPAKKDIAKHVGIKERQVVRVLKELVLSQLIRAVPRTDASGRCTSNEYEFLWHPLLEPSLRGEGVTNDMVARVTQDMDKVTQKSPPRVSSETPLEGRQKNHQHQGDIGKEKSAGHSTPHAKPQNTSVLNRPDDDEGPKVEYATPVDEIKAIAKAKLGHDLPYEDLRWIVDTLELQGISREEYLVEVRKHAGNHWKNPVGMLKSLGKGFRSKLKPSSPPVTKVELEERNYRCPKCKSTTRGEGTHLVAGKFVPCECASSEYIQRLKAKGLLAHSEVAFQIPQALPSRAVSESRGTRNGD